MRLCAPRVGDFLVSAGQRSSIRKMMRIRVLRMAEPIPGVSTDDICYTGGAWPPWRKCGDFCLEKRPGRLPFRASWYISDSDLHVLFSFWTSSWGTASFASMKNLGKMSLTLALRYRHCLHLACTVPRFFGETTTGSPKLNWLQCLL